jgi:hypothetical protein
MLWRTTLLLIVAALLPEVMPTPFFSRKLSVVVPPGRC